MQHKQGKTIHETIVPKEEQLPCLCCNKQYGSCSSLGVLPTAPTEEEIDTAVEQLAEILFAIFMSLSNEEIRRIKKRK